jgi:hypothetical protein
LIGVPALLLLGLAGAGSASGYELCKADETPCASANMYASGTSFSASLVSGTKTQIQTMAVSLECTGSTVAGKTTSTGGSGTTAVSAEITSLTFTGCQTTSGTKCTTSQGVNLPYPAAFTDSLTITDAAGAGGTFHCGVLVNCAYTTTNASLAGFNSVSGMPRMAAQESMSASGAFCSGGATWIAEYEFTAPTPLYVI